MYRDAMWLQTCWSTTFACDFGTLLGSREEGRSYGSYPGDCTRFLDQEIRQCGVREHSGCFKPDLPSHICLQPDLPGSNMVSCGSRLGMSLASIKSADCLHIHKIINNAWRVNTVRNRHHDSVQCRGSDFLVDDVHCHLPCCTRAYLLSHR